MRITIGFILFNFLSIAALAQTWTYPATATTSFLGRVGIGNEAPGFSLHISSTQALDGIRLNNSTNWATLYSPAMTTVAFNGITQSGDAGIIFSGGTGPGTFTHGFVIAPHAAAISGLRVDKDGKVGIRTPNPVTEFQVGDYSQKIAMGTVPLAYREALGWPTQYVGFNLARDAQGWISYSDGAQNGGSMIMADPFGQFKIVGVPSTGNSTRWLTEAQVNQNVKFFISAAGKVGIGTITPEARLSVDGNIQCEEIEVVVVQGTAPDYVFEKDYNLLPLKELEAYINQNKHLPEVPSAKEMEADGLNLREMNLLLLKKVEELTLHLIEVKKEVGQLKDQLAQQKP
jgi:hypothetical protein